MIVLTLKLILAHILGDFVFQPDSWVKDKKKRKHKSPKLYWHLGVHALALLLALQFDFHYWLGILLITVSHFVIDLGKLHAHEKLNGRWLFFIDQALHLIVIASVVYYYHPFNISLSDIYSPQNLLLIVFLLLVTFVTSICMKVLISKWKPEEENKDALKNAGSYIGMLERLFIFGFIVINYWEGIGFLLAAKSVFRFGDLSKAKDRNLTEYILIGTLLSFGLAILIAMGYNYLLEIVNAL
ncbi:MAG: DUF3307 domain-containing protein [Flavobacteriales bacterium]|nr:DUF3307 domain-containing protein [Flavobacteriales bacterium]